MELSNVSQTAIVTLRSRVLAMERNHLIVDPKAQELLKKISSTKYAHLAQKVFPPTLNSYIALRARKFDNYAKDFAQRHSDALIVSLGCGFDTRFWRASLTKDQYIEVDLPSVVQAKKQLIDIPYTILECSVLEDKWLEFVAKRQKQRVLLLCEGLLMYLPPLEVQKLIQRICRTFSQSELVAEVTHKRNTVGIGKKIVDIKMRRLVGEDCGFIFGVKNAREFEDYADNLKISEEWSCFEDRDFRPRILQFFKHIAYVSRATWTVKATIT